MPEAHLAPSTDGPTEPRVNPDDADDWAAALEMGERLIWQGRPVPGGPSGRPDRFWWLFGGVFLLVGLVFLPIGLWVAQMRVIFLPLGAAMLALGIASFLLPHQLARRRLGRMRYALTDRRALVDTGDKLHVWPLSLGVIMDQRMGSPGSIIFGQEPSSITINGHGVMIDLGFLDIAEAPEIAQIIRRLSAPPPVPDGNTSA